MRIAQANKKMVEHEVDYSIIIPVYFNEGCLQTTFTTIKQQVIDQNPGRRAELIFVDDGSRDNSLTELLELQHSNPELVKVIKFTRNFGQVQAILAGFRLAGGKCVINISADLQDPPELINEMLALHFDEGYEIVICSRESREETWFRRLTSQLFYNLMKKLSFPNMPEKGFDFALLGDKVKNFMLEQGEANPFFQGQILWSGYPLKFIPYTRVDRKIGKSRWTLSKKIKYLLDGVLGYSYFPIRMMSVAGAIVAISGFIYALAIFIDFFARGNPVQGWAPLMILLLLLSGVQMLMLGIIGEYLWRTLDEVKKRPGYIIEKIFD